VVGTDLLSLGGVLVKQNRRAEAEPVLREALRNYEARLKPDDVNLSPVLLALGKALRLPQQAAEADALLQRALALNVAAYGADDPRTKKVEAKISGAE
jgi:hypothetical protein